MTESLVEAKPQRWRALAAYKDNKEGLLILGSSSGQVRETYDEPYFELLEEDERQNIHEILLQKFVGAPDRGQWVTQGVLPSPQKECALPIKAR